MLKYSIELLIKESINSLCFKYSSNPDNWILYSFQRGVYLFIYLYGYLPVELFWTASENENPTAFFLYRKGAEIIKIFLCKPFYFEANIGYPFIPNRWNRCFLVPIWHFFWNSTSDNTQRLPESFVYSHSDIFGTNRCMFFCLFWDWWSKPIPVLISLIILP